MKEQQEESPNTVATQTEPVTVCHQGTSVNELLIATGGALLTTERIRVKCHSILYGSARRYVPAASDEEDQPGRSTQTKRKTGCEKVTQTFSDVNIGFNARLAQCRTFQRAEAMKFRKLIVAQMTLETPSGTNNGLGGSASGNGGSAPSKKRAKRSRRKRYRQVPRIQKSIGPIVDETHTLNYYRLNNNNRHM